MNKPPHKPGHAALRKGRGAYRRHGLAKGFFKRRDQAQIERAEVAHRACGRADVERIPRSDEHDAKVG